VTYQKLYKLGAETKKDHPTELCSNPEKYDKSSKAMEALGSVQTVMNLWNNFSNLYCGAIVTDEDGTTRSKLSHSMQEMLEEEISWPTTPTVEFQNLTSQ
jgi:hypothetical protein